MENYQARPTSLNVAPAADATTSRGHKRRKMHHGYGKGSKPQPWAQDRQSIGPPKGENPTIKLDSLGLKASNFKTKGKAQTNQASIA